MIAQVFRSLCLGLLLLAPLQAEDAQEKRSLKHFFQSLGRDQKVFWTAPAKSGMWKAPQTYLLAGVSAASFSLDGDPSRSLRENADFSRFNEILASQAADIVLVAAPFSFWLGGELVRNEDFSEYGRKAGRAVIDAAIVSTLLKLATQRARPHTGEVYGFWEGGNSFPSGHATYAWALAAVTAKHYSGQKWIPWVVYPAAGLIAFSRVTSGNHFMSDAVTGSILGFSIGFFVVD